MTTPESPVNSGSAPIATPHSGTGAGSPMPSSGRRRRIPVIALSAVFVLVVWLAFWLGFQRIHPDYPVSERLGLTAAPVMRFDPAPGGWQRVDEGDPATGEGPQYANLATGNQLVCALSWQIGSITEGTVDLTGFADDAAATVRVLEVGGLNATPDGTVKVRAENGEVIELLYVPQTPEDGVYSATAARTFSDSGHYVLFTVLCDSTDGVTADQLGEILKDATLVIWPRS